MAAKGANFSGIWGQSFGFCGRQSRAAPLHLGGYKVPIIFSVWGQFFVAISTPLPWRLHGANSSPEWFSLILFEPVFCPLRQTSYHLMLASLEWKILFGDNAINFFLEKIWLGIKSSSKYKTKLTKMTEYIAILQGSCECGLAAEVEGGVLEKSGRYHVGGEDIVETDSSNLNWVGGWGWGVYIWLYSSAVRTAHIM